MHAMCCTVVACSTLHYSMLLGLYICLLVLLLTARETKSELHIIASKRWIHSACHVVLVLSLLVHGTKDRWYSPCSH